MQGRHIYPKPCDCESGECLEIGASHVFCCSDKTMFREYVDALGVEFTALEEENAKLKAGLKEEAEYDPEEVK